MRRRRSAVIQTLGVIYREDPIGASFWRCDCIVFSQPRFARVKSKTRMSPVHDHYVWVTNIIREEES